MIAPQSHQLSSLKKVCRGQACLNVRAHANDRPGAIPTTTSPWQRRQQPMRPLPGVLENHESSPRCLATAADFLPFQIP